MNWASLVFILATPLAAETCGPFIEGTTRLDFESRYITDDDSRQIIDETKLAKAEAALAPVDDFIKLLSDQSLSLYHGTVQNRQAAGQCIMKHLAHWTSNDPLSRLESETANLTVASRIAAIALLHWQAQTYAADHPARQQIKAWLTRRIEDQIAFWPTAPKGSQQGNLRAWAALAAAATSSQTDKADFRDWAKSSYETVLCTANPDGSLPQELKRGRLALHYHYHAVAPLVVTAALLERQGTHASASCGGSLHQVAKFALTEIDGGKKTQEITGVEQSYFDGSDDLEVFQLAWIEAYLQLEYSDYLASLSQQLRPLIYSKLGGNQSALWGGY